MYIILTCNNSIFNGQHFIQTNGTATGSKNSCSYADLALEPIDNEIYKTQYSIFKELSTYYRFRDDCFLIWNGDIDLINNFVYFVNILDPSLKFTVEIGGKSLKFMDLLITIENGELKTTVYSKPTDGHLYLHHNSCHPKSTKLAIQKGVALRLRRICSSDEEFLNKAKEYKAYLVSRGHNPKDVITNFEKARNISRNEAGNTCKKNNKNYSKKHRFLTEHNPGYPNVANIIKSHEHLIRNNETLNRIFPTGSFQVVKRRGKNLKECILIADPYATRTINTLYSYKKCRVCDSCKNFVVGASQIKSFATGRVFHLRKNMNCNTPHVVYVAECIKCLIQGVGSTQYWKPRLSNYKCHITKGIKTCRIVRHFIEGCPGNENPCENLRFHIIDCVDNNNGYTSDQIDELLLEKEKMWIKNLVTAHKGMNSSHDLNRRNRCEREKLD